MEITGLDRCLPCPPMNAILRVEEVNGFAAEYRTLQTEPGVTMPFYLLRPKGEGTGGHPVLIVPHGHGGGKEKVLRDQARTEFLDSALQRAQQELAQTDSLLEVAKVRHQQLQQAIKKDPYSKRLERELTEARRLVDSLQVSWNTQGAKIKYLHRKQKQP
jgi:hypothetical protein